MTSSSKLAFPLRSPRPFTHVCGTSTPTSRAARLFAGHVQLVLQVEVRARDEDRDLVHAALDARLDILTHGPARGQDRRVEPRVRDELHAAVLLLRDDRDPDVHDVDAHLAQDPRDLQLLFRGEVDAGGLLAVAHRLVPEEDLWRELLAEARLDVVIPDEAFVWNWVLFLGQCIHESGRPI